MPRVLGLVLLLACAGCRAGSGDEVVVGECTKVRASEHMPMLSTYSQEGGALALVAARGETLGVQLRLTSAARTEVRLELPNECAEVEAFAVRYLDVTEPSTKLYGRYAPSRGQGSYPDVLVPTSTSVTGHVYFDIAVPAGAPPGRCVGRLAVGGRSREIFLDILPVTVRLEEAPLVWVFYHPKEIARQHDVPDDNGPGQLAWEERYRALFRKHGAYLLADLPPERYAARKSFYEGLTYLPVAVRLDSAETIRHDVTAWQRILDGADHAVRPFVIAVDEPQTDEDRVRAAKMARLIAEGHDPGARTRILPAVTAPFRDAFAGIFDIYFAPTQIPQVRAVRAQAGAKELFFPYNGYPPLAGSMVIDTEGVSMRTWGWIAFRYGVDLWYAWEGLYFHDRYNDRFGTGEPRDLFTNPLTFDERRRQRRDPARSQAGEVKAVGADREQALPSGADRGNGDGLLVYPPRGAPGAAAGTAPDSVPLPSLRLKALRRGLLDRLLLLRLAECGQAEMADELGRQMIPRALGDAAGLPSWPMEEVTWERARRRLLEENASRCPDRGPGAATGAGTMPGKRLPSR